MIAVSVYAFALFKSSTGTSGSIVMPALTSIDGMGEKAAQQVEEAAKGEPFTSLENFRNRTKAPQACIEKMKELGIMGDLSDTDQLSFDFL